MNSSPEYCSLRAGSLTAEYFEGTLRNISLYGTEILRMIYAAVRDEKWLNVPFKVIREEIVAGERDFTVKLEALFKKENIEFQAEYMISGSPESEITFEFKGTASTGFMKNRVGICVLHPPETCKGKECVIVHPDKTLEKKVFPQMIAPHQPFKNISSMAWKIGQNSAALQFEGDIFETEDQRNWTDASYKTYSTPLSIPFPVFVEEGTVIRQSVTLSVSGFTPGPVRNSGNLQFEIETGSLMPLPEIGIGVTSRVKKLTNNEALLLKACGFRHIRAELHLFADYWPVQYKKMIHECGMLGLPAELCLLFGDDYKSEFAGFIKYYLMDPVNIKSVLLLSGNHKATPADLVCELVPLINSIFKGIPVGSGTNCNFAELNRALPDRNPVDFLSFAIHPQEHASDDRTLFENTAAQADAVLTARMISCNKPVYVSPVTLHRRFNANVACFESHADALEMSNADPRQKVLFAAAWTVGSLKSIIESGAASVTYYELAGEKGILNNDSVFPVYHVFKALANGYQLLKSVSSDPMTVNGLALVKRDHGLIFLVNYTSQTQEIDCRACWEFPGESVRLNPYETRIFNFRIL